MVNIRSIDDLPKMERWWLRDHVPETVSTMGPFLARYLRYRAVAPPPEMHLDVVRYGYYNWCVAELWTRETPMPSTALALIYFSEYDEIVAVPPGSPGHHPPKWNGSATVHPIVSGQVPVNITNDFLGSQLNLNDPPFIRWFIFFKYPDNVSIEEGDNWYLNIHAKEVMKQPGLMRFFSYRVSAGLMGGRVSPWHRVSEQWYADFSSWRKAIIESPLKYTKPSWAKYDKYPFFEPYVDFCSTFLLERPTNDNLRDYSGYITM
jgi:hypothetical protein